MAIPGFNGEVLVRGSSSYIPIDSIWEGTETGYNLIWDKWYFKDDFERTTLGPNWNPASGATIVSGELRKNSSNGSSDNWTAQSFPTDDLRVVTTLGTIHDANQRSSISIGSPNQYVYCEFSVNGGAIGEYNGTAWKTLANVPSMALARNDTIELRRWGTLIYLIHNGSTRMTANSSQGIGPNYRRVNLSVRRDSNIFGTYWSPTYEEVKVGRHKPSTAYN